MRTNLLYSSFVFLLVTGLLYAAFLLTLSCSSRLQREVFYLNAIKFPWLVDLRRPELSGFSATRCRSIFIRSTIHAWHIAPFSSLSDNSQTSGLKVRPESKLIVYLHGTAGTIAVPHRLTSYRILSALPDTHVLAIDYRGFGLSSGIPSEAGIIDDTADAVKWALTQGFLASQIVLFGQSLGAAVAIATAHRLALLEEEPVYVDHVVSVAGFSTARDVVKTYRIAGSIPILGPLRTYPWIQNQILNRLEHRWDSETRIYELARQTDIKLTIAHAQTDTEILCENSQRLWLKALAGINAKPEAHHVDVLRVELPDGGSKTSLNSVEESKLKYLEMYWGAHNIVSWNDELLKILLTS